MSTTTDALQRAIDYIHATEVAPGRYAWCDAERWYCTDATNLADVVEREYPLAEDGPKYAVPMPSWWTPGRRFAYRNIKTGEIIEDSTSLHRSYWNEGSIGIITADLETGAEVPA